MVGYDLKKSFLVLAFVFGLWNEVSWAQAAKSQGINYKLVPNLAPMKDNSPTPDFTLPDPEGKKISLKDFKGKLVFLNFWASWCVPCREEMPAMERLYQQYKTKGFVILAVNVKDSRRDALAFIKELKLTYPIVLDPDGDVGLLYGAFGLARVWGPAEWYGAEAKQLIQELLDGKR